MSKTIIITSGYFNPIHPWHIECFLACKELGDELWVIVNNDIQAKLKTGKEEVFQDEQCRTTIVSALKTVDRIMISIDTDSSVCKSIQYIAKLIRSEYGSDTAIIFGKGGDRFADNIPEVTVCRESDIQIRDGLGSKTHNSSEYRAREVPHDMF